MRAIVKSFSLIATFAAASACGSSGAPPGSSGGGPTGADAPITTLGLAASPLHVAVDAKNVYAASIYAGAKVWAVPLAGGDAKVLATLDIALNLCKTLASDGSFVYVAGRDAANAVGIWKIPVDGGPPIPLVSDLTGSCLALDGGMVYYLDGNGGVRRVPAAGGEVQKLYDSKTAKAHTSIAAVDGVVFWAKGLTLARAPGDGTAPPTEIASLPPGNRRLVTNGKFVYADGDAAGGAQIIRVPVNGGSAEVIAPGGDIAGMTADATGLYISSGELDSPGVRFVADGTTELRVINRVWATLDLAVDAQAIYWVNGANSTIQKMPR